MDCDLHYREHGENTENVSKKPSIGLEDVLKYSASGLQGVSIQSNSNDSAETVINYTTLASSRTAGAYNWEFTFSYSPCQCICGNTSFTYNNCSTNVFEEQYSLDNAWNHYHAIYISMLYCFLDSFVLQLLYVKDVFPQMH